MALRQQGLMGLMCIVCFIAVGCGMEANSVGLNGRFGMKHRLPPAEAPVLGLQFQGRAVEERSSASSNMRSTRVELSITNTGRSPLVISRPNVAIYLATKAELQRAGRSYVRHVSDGGMFFAQINGLFSQEEKEAFLVIPSGASLTKSADIDLVSLVRKFGIDGQGKAKGVELNFIAYLTSSRNGQDTSLFGVEGFSKFLWQGDVRSPPIRCSSMVWNEEETTSN